MPELSHLELEDNAISDLSPLTDLAATLVNLNVSRNNLVDITPVAALQNLVAVNFGGNNISDVDALGGAFMPGLQYITLWGNPLNQADVALLTAYTELHNLNLDGTGISSLPPLPGSLRSLRAERNSISDVSGLAGLASLNLVSLRDNHITVLPDLSGLTSITHFNVSNNAIGDLAPLAQLPPGADVISDVGRPDIDGITLSTNTLDLTVNTCFNLTVDGFGGGLNYRSPVGNIEFGTGFADGQQTTICLNPDTANGVWDISRIDVDGGFTYNGFAVAQLGLSTAVTVSGGLNDTTPPILTGFNPTPLVVDLDAGPALIDLNLVATDAGGSGVGGFSINIHTTTGFHQNQCCEDVIPLSVTTPAGVLRILIVNVFDQAGNVTSLQRSELLALGGPTEIVIDNNLTQSFPAVAGEWFNSEGGFDGARGNPAYQFTVDAPGGVVVIVLESGDVAAVTLDLFDANGVRLVRADQHQPRAILGQNLAAGDYVVLAQNQLGGGGTFSITLEGSVVMSVAVDTDQDGLIDTVDLDDDDDGISDVVESSLILEGMNPLDFFDADEDFDGDGFTNREEILAGTDINNSSSQPPD